MLCPYIRMLVCYKRVLRPALTWLNPENVKLSGKARLVEEITYWMRLFMDVFGTGKFTEVDSRLAIISWHKTVTANGFRVSLWADETILALDRVIIIVWGVQLNRSHKTISGGQWDSSVGKELSAQAWLTTQVQIPRTHIRWMTRTNSRELPSGSTYVPWYTSSYTHNEK